MSRSWPNICARTPVFTVFAAAYCSARCQGMDWLCFYSHYKPHREFCLSSR
ncbi:hypothetical protein RSAG8_10193, partial [Rhizoctonia solani AG-8 WAC10335]